MHMHSIATAATAFAGILWTVSVFAAVSYLIGARRAENMLMSLVLARGGRGEQPPAHNGDEHVPSLAFLAARQRTATKASGEATGQLVDGTPDVLRSASFTRDDTVSLRHQATALLLAGEPEKGLLMSRLAALADALALRCRI
jgi:hypothetical protein